ncbi:hypothetical protein EI982_00685 (plasmid) [Haloplanus rallus]|uniref:Uncharacterized protein n=1 Tax=Haloplanus rallus TaxID=1816183 RepID=A0A6B9F4R5_9EURY|nr:hypothetical protein EI982_00685 [Haloplanus rallus]
MRSLSRRVFRGVFVLAGLLLTGTSPALAQSDDSGDGGALGDIIIDAIQELLEILFSPIESVIQSHGDAVLRVVVGTPHPDAVFSQPTNGAWPGIYEYYWQMILPLTLSLYGLSIGLVIFLESTSHLFNGYHRSKLKKRAFAGLLGILSWWWIAALSMRFMDALAGFLVPSVSEISLFQTLSFTGMGVLGTIVALSTNFILFVLIGLIYLARQLALYLFVFLMPLLIVFWIPGVGPFSLVSKFMKKLAGFYVPFLFMTVPVALLFRLGDILGTSFGLSAGEFGAWLTALIIPLVAVASPFILFWQAGALFFIADRAARHVSAQKARGRLSRGRERLQSAKQGGKNFVRGVRDEPAVKSGGQYVLNSGDSRAHATGQRLNTTGSRLREAISDGGGGDGGQGGSGGSGGGSTASTGSGGDGGGNDGSGEFERDEALRDPQPRNRNRESRDDPPRYIQ